MLQPRQHLTSERKIFWSCWSDVQLLPEVTNAILLSCEDRGNLHLCPEHSMCNYITRRFRVKVFCFSLPLQSLPVYLKQLLSLPVPGFYTYHALTHINFHIHAHREIDVSVKSAVCATVLTQNQCPSSSPALGKPHPAIISSGNPTCEAALRLPLTV